LEWSCSFDINGTTFGDGSGGSSGSGQVTLDGHSLVLLNLRATDPRTVRAVRVTVPGVADRHLSAHLRQLAPTVPFA
jgi:hypothetical protein